MKLKLEQATFLRRYKRFMADVKLPGGEEITVHCPNSGSMKSLLNEGVPCWIHDSGNPKRKLRFTLTLLGLPEGGCALVDTQRPNAMVEEAILEDRIPELSGYPTLKREVRYGSENSRIDIHLTGDKGQEVFVEVKNNTMLSHGVPHRSDFPDAVTTRGQKHLRELQQMVDQGHRAVMFYLVNRTDAKSCGIAEDIDPVYAETLREAMKAGVEVLCYGSRLEEGEIVVDRAIPFDFV